jgi:hypothetical protein
MHASALMTTTARAIAKDTEAAPRPTVPVSFGFGADAAGISPVTLRHPAENRAEKVSQRSEIGLVPGLARRREGNGLSVP